jgi:hypothetical protein
MAIDAARFASKEQSRPERRSLLVLIHGSSEGCGGVMPPLQLKRKGFDSAAAAQVLAVSGR